MATSNITERENGGEADLCDQPISSCNYGAEKELFGLRVAAASGGGSAFVL